MTPGAIPDWPWDIALECTEGQFVTEQAPFYVLMRAPLLLMASASKDATSLLQACWLY